MVVSRLCQSDRENSWHSFNGYRNT